MKKRNKHAPKVQGTIGSENYMMSDCPFHLPKQNMTSFMMMRNAHDESLNRNGRGYANGLSTPYK